MYKIGATYKIKYLTNFVTIHIINYNKIIIEYLKQIN